MEGWEEGMERGGTESLPTQSRAFCLKHFRGQGTIEALPDFNRRCGLPPGHRTQTDDVLPDANRFNIIYFFQLWTEFQETINVAYFQAFWIKFPGTLLWLYLGASRSFQLPFIPFRGDRPPFGVIPPPKKGFSFTRGMPATGLSGQHAPQAACRSKHSRNINKISREHEQNFKGTWTKFQGNMNKISFIISEIIFDAQHFLNNFSLQRDIAVWFGIPMRYQDHVIDWLLPWARLVTDRIFIDSHHFIGIVL
jgi:hypothetical protein